jgi:2-C-methyl-D-erythritol 4-phosphate cytidylyltransferase / 2-C-methyl-D-erythritol 2,4-cyclodiphosphate synthase
MNNCFIILAAGESKRFNSITPKPYHIYRGKPLIMHSIDKILKNRNFNKIIVVVNRKHKKYFNKLKFKNLKLINGGKTRADSAYKALKIIKRLKIKNVLIHDAARPNFSLKLIEKIIKELRKNDCVVPAIKTNDSVKFKKKDIVTNIKRENIYLTQTPQGFNYNQLFKLQKDQSTKITDDSNLFIAARKKIKIIKGETNNNKITFGIDLKSKNMNRYGIGFDIHRLIPKKKFYLGGIIIPFNLGTLGHSDGDAVLHAIIDSSSKT